MQGSVVVRDRLKAMLGTCISDTHRRMKSNEDLGKCLFDNVAVAVIKPHLPTPQPSAAVTRANVSPKPSFDHVSDDERANVYGAEDEHAHDDVDGEAEDDGCKSEDELFYTDGGIYSRQQ